MGFGAKSNFRNFRQFNSCEFLGKATMIVLIALCDTLAAKSLGNNRVSNSQTEKLSVLEVTKRMCIYE
ncbi:hypothetical protein CEP86_24680 [Pseudomonas protegens]|nr:hypothetical protein CEP86_24680 [Pseudomonas protegens]